MRLLFALALLVTQPALAAQYWLAGVDPVNRVAKGRDNPMDYMDLFSPSAPWQQAASRLSVFKISAQMAISGQEDDLRRLFADLHRRHVAVAVETAAMLRSPECGFGEGYAPPDLLDRVGTRLQSLGLTIEYLAMDEPVWFGHEKTWGRNNCAYPVQEVAMRVARGVAQIRRYFPRLKVGDIEVVADRIEPGRLAGDYGQFAQLFAQYTGTPLAFLHADLGWQGDWQPALAAVFGQMRALGVPVGMIIGGGRAPANDAEFGDAAIEHLRQAMDNAVTRPDEVVVHSWQPLPDRMLPETVAGSATNILLRAESLLR